MIACVITASASEVGTYLRDWSRIDRNDEINWRFWCFLGVVNGSSGFGNSIRTAEYEAFSLLLLLLLATNDEVVEAIVVRAAAKRRQGGNEAMRQ
jgi:hypothetical protein